MMLGNQLRGTRLGALGVGAIIFIIIFAGLAYNHLGAWDLPARPTQSVPTLGHDVSQLDGNVNASDAFSFYFEHLYKPSIKPDSRKYRPYNAFKWELKTDKPHFDKPMGEKLCIIDLDNRPFDGAHQLFGPNVMSWTNGEDVHGLSLGVLNHWLYAKIHGYKYYYIAIDTPEDRRASWKKPPIMSKILKKHDTCIYLDSDALFHRLDLPFEWLMNYWKIDPAVHSLSLAVDPDRDFNLDKFGKLYLNTGFIVAQNNPKTYEIMHAWQKCPDEGEPYPECTQFRKNVPGKPTDQGGFGTYVRYTFKDNIKELPCTEANGFPLSNSGCDGTFIRHLWTGKDDWIKIDFGAQTPGPFLEMFHQQYLAEKKNFYLTEAQLMAQ